MPAHLDGFMPFASGLELGGIEKKSAWQGFKTLKRYRLLFMPT
jgi:hypothetical protein